MIVADATLIVHFSMPGSKTERAEAVRRKDPVWVAPPLWEYEVLNVIWTYVHFKALPLTQALEHWDVAQDLIGERTTEWLRPKCFASLPGRDAVPTIASTWPLLSIWRNGW